MTLEIMAHTASKTPQACSSFSHATGELVRRKFFKSCAQVASSVAPHVAHSVAHEVLPHSIAGLRPLPHIQKNSCTHGLRLRPGELDLIRQKAKQYDMKVNAYLRAKALGDDYIEKPPEWLRDTLLKLYVELVRQGNNLNQIARNVNKGFVSAEAAMATADQHRAPMFRLIEKLELALAGRKPPDDY